MYAWVYGRNCFSRALTQWKGLPVWRLAAALHAVMATLGVVSTCATCAFAGGDALEHATWEGALYAQPPLLALYAALQTWTLRALQRDVRRAAAMTVIVRWIR